MAASTRADSCTPLTSPHPCAGQTGIQEKTTLVQLMRKLSVPQLRGSTITLPATLLLLLAALGILVM